MAFGRSRAREVNIESFGITRQRSCQIGCGNYSAFLPSPDGLEIGGHFDVDSSAMEAAPPPNEGKDGIAPRKAAPRSGRWIGNPGMERAIGVSTDCLGDEIGPRRLDANVDGRATRTAVAERHEHDLVANRGIAVPTTVLAGRYFRYGADPMLANSRSASLLVESSRSKS